LPHGTPHAEVPPYEGYNLDRDERFNPLARMLVSTRAVALRLSHGN
jgi:hypothetical protein